MVTLQLLYRYSILTAEFDASFVIRFFVIVRRKSKFWSVTFRYLAHCSVIGSLTKTTV